MPPGFIAQTDPDNSKWVLFLYIYIIKYRIMKQQREFGLTDKQRMAIARRFATTRTDELAAELGLNYFLVQRAAKQMGMEKRGDFREAVSAIARKGCRGEGYYKSGTDRRMERDEWLRINWPTTPDEVCADHFGVNPRTVRRWAHGLGLRKDPETSRLNRAVGLRLAPEVWFQRVAYIAEQYPTEKTSGIAEALGISPVLVRNIACKYGIRKQKQRE